MSFRCRVLPAEVVSAHSAVRIGCHSHPGQSLGGLRCRSRARIHAQKCTRCSLPQPRTCAHQLARQHGVYKYLLQFKGLPVAPMDGKTSTSNGELVSTTSRLVCLKKRCWQGTFLTMLCDTVHPEDGNLGQIRFVMLMICRTYKVVHLQLLERCRQTLLKVRISIVDAAPLLVPCSI